MNLSKYIPIVLLLFFSYWAVKPLFSSGFFSMHDDTQVGRVIEMGKALRNGQFPVRWVGDLGYGYGYPLFNFYGPLPYYVGGFLYFLGVDALIATKVMFVIGILLAPLMMYVLVRSLTGAHGGFLSAILFLYAPYHAVDIYVRGAVGEYWAIAFLPLVVYGLVHARRKRTDWIIGALGISGVILSHTILGYVTVLFVVFGILFYMLIRRIFVKELVLLVLIGLGISAFFWLAATGEMGYTNVISQIGGTADFKNHFVCIGQLWNSAWGFGGSAPGCLDGLSFQIGKILLFIAVASLPVLPRMAALWGMFIAIGSVIFMTRISETAWNIIPGFAYIQYPWRFLSYAIFGLSLAGGSTIMIFRNFLLRWIAALALSVITVFFYAKLFGPQYVYERPSRDFESANDLRWRVSKISDEYLPPDMKKPGRFEDTPQAPFSHPQYVAIDTEINTETYSKAQIQTPQDADIIINRAVFPGWHYLVDGKEVVEKVADGIPRVHITSGSHILEISFSDTPVRYFGNLITIFSIVFIFYFINRKI